MATELTTITVPAEARYARAVRMLALNLGVVQGLSLEDADDIRMVAEEGFVYACATKPKDLKIDFVLTDKHFTMKFYLGNVNPEDTEESFDLSLVEAVIDAVCSDWELSDDNVLRLELATGVFDAN